MFGDETFGLPQATVPELQLRVRELEETLKERDHTLGMIATVGTLRWKWLQSTVALQADAYGHEFPKQGEDLGAWIRTNVTALTAEVGEALKEIGWKPWSTGQGYVNREAYLGELVDAGHFLANLLVAVGITDEEWEAAYQRKQQVNRDRQAAGYDTRAEKCPACGRAYDDAAVACHRPTSTMPAPYCEDYGYLETTTA